MIVQQNSMIKVMLLKKQFKEFLIIPILIIQYFLMKIRFEDVKQIIVLKFIKRLLNY